MSICAGFSLFSSEIPYSSLKISICSFVGGVVLPIPLLACAIAFLEIPILSSNRNPSFSSLSRFVASNPAFLANVSIVSLVVILLVSIPNLFNISNFPMSICAGFSLFSSKIPYSSLKISICSFVGGVV